ncbi:MAG TPA: ABC transporter ATP-binding protein, partial [Chloroflexota bacterium]|nr:ABC transporter ATP-binding protein [Chloroflexota bacterium]
DEAERLADRVAIIDDGRLIALGTPAELTAGDEASDVRLTVSDDLPLAALAALPSARAVQPGATGQFRLRTDRASDLLVELAICLRERGVVPRELRIGQGSLEEVFLRLTGKELRE